MLKKNLLLLTGSMIISSLASAMDLPWKNGSRPDPSGLAPEQSGRPTPDNPNARPPSGIPEDCEVALSSDAYRRLAYALTSIHHNRGVQAQLRDFGMEASTVSYQDAARSHGSVVGPNISDARLLAYSKDRAGRGEFHALPVIRLPNREDITVDVDMASVTLPVGNAWGVPLFGVPLQAVLENVQNYLSWREPIKGSLFAPERDHQVLVSAQASILPVPEGGTAYFAPSLYNYQSRQGYPAVLVILVSNRGTSITVIENSRDAIRAEGISAAGQILYHNKNGEKALFTAESLRTVNQSAAGRDRVDQLQNSGQSIAGQKGVNQVMMIQVPLMYPRPRVMRGGAQMLSFGGPDYLERSVGRTTSLSMSIDDAVVDVAGFTMGKFLELNGTGPKLVRDPNFPIRIDVALYKTLSHANPTPDDIRTLPEELRGIYTVGSNIGSLVTGDNLTRVTRNYKAWEQPWWNSVVHPYMPAPYWPHPWDYWTEKFGPDWVYRFANSEMAARTVGELTRVAN